MKSNIRTIKKRRIYSEEFKLQIVKEFESGKFSILQLERLHGISNVTLYNWIYKLSTFNEKGNRIVEYSESSNKKVKDLEFKLKELERIIGQKQIQIDYLEKLIDLAQEELNIDIKKNYNTSQSGGSKNIKN